MISENDIRGLADHKIERRILELSDLYYMFDKYGQEFEKYLQANNKGLYNDVYKGFLCNKFKIVRHPSYVSLVDLIDGKSKKLNKLTYTKGAYKESEITLSSQDGTSHLGIEDTPVHITRNDIQTLLARGENIQEIVDRYLPYATSIGEDAFWECAELNSITIPGSVKSIGSGAFYMCWACTFTAPNKEIKDMLINSLVDEYRIAVQGEENQWWIPVDGRLVVPDGVECIEDHMFQARDDIMSVEIPNSVISIGKYAFGESCKLTSITIPCDAEISSRALHKCAALEHIFIKCQDGVISSEKAEKIRTMIRCSYVNPDKVHFINAEGQEIQPTPSN